MAPVPHLPNPEDPVTQVSPGAADLNAKAPVWLAFLAAGLCVAGTSVRMDKGGRKALEVFHEPTAVGDRAWFPREGSSRPELRFRESTLREASGEIEIIPDVRMRVVGRTDDGALRLYVPEERANGVEETGGPSWFVKTGPSQFLRLTTR